LIVSPDALEGGAAASAKRAPNWSTPAPTAEQIAAALADRGPAEV